MSTEKRINSELAAENESLKAERDRFQQINKQTLQVKLQMAETIKKLLAENVELKQAGNKMFLSAISLMEDPELKIDHSRDIKDWERNETPATDAALSAIRTESHIAGIEAAANRVGVISLQYKAGQKQELIRAIGRAVLQYATELREAK
ncbi:hypothetical protein [Serratia marcescens]|uniref:hypothetical protein n=1 Tax=Serratia marcescens TaxID=615 RepID=UPI000F7D827D|nr:hypothetical protein [Serratia marcescens]RTF47797.1 hypothetical protein D9B78_11705 [Serratia marcescens]